MFFLNTLKLIRGNSIPYGLWTASEQNESVSKAAVTVLAVVLKLYGKVLQLS